MGFDRVYLLLQTIVLTSLLFLLTQNLQWETFSALSLSLPQENSISNVLFLTVRLFACFIIWSSIFIIVADREGLKVVVADSNGNQKKVHLYFLERLTMFTVWCWVLQGIYFFVASYFSILTIYPVEVSKYQFFQISDATKEFALRLAWISYEISLPVAFLVSLVVKFVLIPGIRKFNIPTNVFFNFFPLLFHNANVAFMVFEFTTNRIPIYGYHIPFIALYGASYVVFSWFWYKYKGVFYYFFLDYNRPYTLLWHLGLIAVLMVLFAMCYVWHIYRSLEGPYFPNLAAILLGFASIQLTPDGYI